MNKDLTVGKPEQILWRYCLPLFASVLFQQFYNLADSYVAGKMIGEKAFAAVGNSYEATLIFIALSVGCNIGASVVIARLFGAKKYRDMKTAVFTTLITCSILLAILVPLGLFFSRTLLTSIHTPPEIMADSLLYLRIYIAGLPFLFFYNICTGIFSALGDSKTPFIFLACSSTVNVAMDIFFVQAIHRGVASVAWATFICQGISCILAVYFVLRRLHGMQIKEKAPLFSFPILKDIAKIAIPSMLQQSFISVGNIVLQGIINSFGTGVVAGYSASVKLNNLMVSSLMTVANGISHYTAQNLGAEKKERVNAGFFAGAKLEWLLCLPMAVTYFFFGRALIRFFIENPTEDALMAGAQFMHIVTPFYFLAATKIVSDGVLRGAGLMNQFMAGTLIDLFLRVVLAFFLSKPFGSTGIWLSWPIGWIIGTSVSLFFCYRGVLKKNRLLE